MERPVFERRDGEYFWLTEILSKSWPYVPACAMPSLRASKFYALLKQCRRGHALAFVDTSGPNAPLQCSVHTHGDKIFVCAPSITPAAAIRCGGVGAPHSVMERDHVLHTGGDVARTKRTVLCTSGYKVSISKPASKRHSNCEDLVVGVCQYYGSPSPAEYA